MFNFKNLIEKYADMNGPITVIKETEGYYDPNQGGKYVPGEIIETEVKAAIMPLSLNEMHDQLQYNEGGAYTREDRKIYTFTELEIGQKIRHKDIEYLISEGIDYSDYEHNGLRVYYARRVGP